VALLDVSHLSTHITLPGRTVRAVDDVSFSIEAGETVGLVGESGSGKTMTGSSIMRLLPAAGRIVSGSVTLAGKDLTALSEREMRRARGELVGMIFQDPMTSLNPTQTIGEQVAEPLIIHGRANGRAARERAKDLLDMVGVPRPAERLGTYPHQLSGGLRQRVMIATALACSPMLLIADEPTTALDVSIQDQILSLLERLKSELGMAILLVTHDMGVIASNADRVLVMYAGRIVESAPTTELFARPRHRYTEALLESLPSLDQDRRRSLYSIPGTPPDLTLVRDECRFAPRCRFAADDCRAGTPELRETVPGHSHACLHPRSENAELVVAPVPDHESPIDMPPREREVVLRLGNLVREFPIRSAIAGRAMGTVKAVSDVSLELYRGETLGLVGESGCGKTTIGRMMVALDKPTSGTVEFEGQGLAGLSGRALRRLRRNLQMIFQDPYASLDPRMRVEAIVGEPLAVQRIERGARRRERVFELLRDVGLAESAARLFPREFSGGQRQRIGIARSLAVTPQVIVADEPVSALDISIRSQLLNLLRRLQAEHDLTFVMISHDLSVIRYLADRVAVMYLGKLVEIGPTASVYEQTVHPYTAGLLEAIPNPDPERARRRGSVAVRGELPSPIDPPSGCRFRTRCPRAQDICALEEPPLRPFGEDGHLAACHVPLREPAGTAVGATA
jgi:peptide/nickel transport system ATP-binding protein